ncbi:MAG TPA: ABC transporter permease, partial [Myxococcales bacterium]|nr:ABC transporter permease [Myxococcales bacterium]
MLSDLKFAARTLRQAPGVAAAAVLALGLGIGASTAIFSVLDGVLYKPLPFPHPEQLARIFQVPPKSGDNDWSPANYFDLARETRAFSSVAIWYDFAANLRTDESVERVPVVAISQTFFGTLGVRPALGRDFAPGEDLDGAERMAIVGDDFFRRVLHGDAAAIGKTISLNNRPVRVVGVLPRGFLFAPRQGAQVYVPARFDADDQKNRGSHYFNVIGRLAPGKSLSQAQPELRLIAARLAEVDPAQNAGWSARAVEFRDELVGPVSGTLHLLLGAVLLLLLVACANVAGLLLARGAARGREIAIRAAMGAGQGRLIRQLLVESILVAAVGGIVGLCLAAWSVDALVALAPQGLPRLQEIRVDARVAAFGIVLSVASGVAAGLWPAFQASRIGLVEA